MLKANYLVLLLKKYLRCNNVNPDIHQLRLTLESDPSYPSLLSIRQTCTYFGIKTNAYKGDYEGLLESRKPAIVHWKAENEEKFVLVIEVTPESVTYYDATNQKTTIISKDDFCKFWTGALILSEKKEDQKAAVSNTAIRAFWVYGLVLVAILIVFITGYRNSSGAVSIIFAVFLLFFKIAGVWITAYIIRHEAGFFNLPFDNFCNKLEFFDCNKVLDSNASKLFNKFPLSDIGLVYFSTGFFAILISVLSGIHNEILLFLFNIAVGVIPFVLFSILYQKFIVKKWCPLCLSVMGLVVLENLLFLLYPGKTITITYSLFLGYLFLTSMLLSIPMVLSYKNLINAQGDAFRQKLQNLQLKRNPAVIVSLFNNQKKTEIPQTHSIVIGNQESPLVITTLLSPLCKPCKRIVLEILKLIKNYPESFLWQIRFDGIEKEVYNPINRIQLHIKQLCDNEQDDSAKIQIIKDWYSRQSFQWFAERYPIDKIAPETIVGLAEQINDNARLNVTRVPILWINNRMLPQEYAVLDIPFLYTDVQLLLQLTK